MSPLYKRDTSGPEKVMDVARVTHRLRIVLEFVVPCSCLPGSFSLSLADKLVRQNPRSRPPSLPGASSVYPPALFLSVSEHEHSDLLLATKLEKPPGLYKGLLLSLPWAKPGRAAKSWWWIVVVMGELGRKEVTLNGLCVCVWGGQSRRTHRNGVAAAGGTSQKRTLRDLD